MFYLIFLYILIELCLKTLYIQRELEISSRSSDKIIPTKLENNDVNDDKRFVASVNKFDLRNTQIIPTLRLPIT